MNNSTKTSQQYFYNFVGGGWNSEWADNKKEAITAAKKRWKGSKSLVVDESSFRISTDEQAETLASLFY
jgi:hypothetical protein